MTTNQIMVFAIGLAMFVMCGAQNGLSCNLHHLAVFQFVACHFVAIASHHPTLHLYMSACGIEKTIHTNGDKIS